MTIQPAAPRSTQEASRQAAAPVAPAPAATQATIGPAHSAPQAEADRFLSAEGARRDSPAQAQDALEQADRIRTARRSRTSGAASAAALPVDFRLKTRETGHDSVGIVGRPSTLEVKLELAGPELASPDLGGKDITFRVNGAVVGTAKTDADGVARIPFTPSAVGNYNVTYELARPEDRKFFADDPRGAGTLFVNPDRPTLVVDIDGTLSDYPELKVPFSGEKAPAFKNSVETLNRLSKDYNIVYLTARDDALDEKTRGFLFKDHDPGRDGLQAFPPGAVLYNDLGWTSYKELSQLDSDRHAAFKTEAIKRLQLGGIPVVAGIGNASTDDTAYRGTKLDSFILDKKLEAEKPGQFYSDLQKTLTDKTRLDTYGKRVQEVVEQRNLTDPAAILQRDLDVLSGSRATAGNSVQLYIDGDTARPEFLKALDSAKDTITYQSFEFLDDAAGRAVANKLAEKARQGVQVRVVIDAAGSRQLPPLHENPLVALLRQAGAEVQVFNPVTGPNLPDAIHRDHRKAIVIDGGKTAFLGGMNTAEPYLGSDQAPPKYHDIFAQMQGPAAKDVQDIFCRTWMEAGGTLNADEMSRLYRNMDRDRGGPGTVRIVNHIPKEDFHIKDTYLRMIQEAKDHIYVENSFPMDRELVDALVAAARRGVRVDYIYGQLSNLDPMHLVTENKFPELLAAGVNIWRYPQFVHTKSLSVDGKIASVGSSNVDNFSLEMDREAVAVVQDPAWVAEMERTLFSRDIQRSTRIPSDPKDPFWRHNLPREVLDALWPDFLE